MTLGEISLLLQLVFKADYLDGRVARVNKLLVILTGTSEKFKEL